VTCGSSTAQEKGLENYTEWEKIETPLHAPRKIGGKGYKEVKGKQFEGGEEKGIREAKRCIRKG